MNKHTEHYFQLDGLRCSSCVHKIESHLNNLRGVDSVTVNFAESSLLVHGAITPGEVTSALQTLGYPANWLSADLPSNESSFPKDASVLRAAVAGFVGFPLMFFSMMQLLPALPVSSLSSFWITISLLCLSVLLFSGKPYFKGAYCALKTNNPTMDTLIALGTGSAWLYSTAVILFPESIPVIARHAYFEASVIILAFVNLGHALEARAKERTSRAITALVALQPTEARKVGSSGDKTLSIQNIQQDDILRVLPGERLPADGVITDGFSRVDESMLSGEAEPVQKQVGDSVAAGSINNSGLFCFKVTATAENTTLSRIITLVRQAQAARPPITRLVDKIARYFVPAVILIAVGSAITWYLIGPEPKLAYLFVSGMTVLIIACPCALGLAAPIAIMTAVGKAAELGILLQRGEALQTAGKLTTVLLDKTGTITFGKPVVTQIEELNSLDKDRLLQLAASLENSSEHGLASAILQAARDASLSLLPCEAVTVSPGKGLKGTVDGKAIVLGNAAYLNEHSLTLSKEVLSEAEGLQKQGHTVSYLACDHEVAGYITSSDPVKEDSWQAIRALKELGCHVVMVTGDHQSTAECIAEQVGIKTIFAEASPEDKATIVNSFKEKGDVVAMVGDGINDAPALSSASVGFAIGTGTDIAIESADIILMQGSLHSLVDSITLSKRTLRVIKQNLFGAFLYNSLAIPIAAGALYAHTGFLLNPSFAGAAMALSSLTVVLNALRLRRFDFVEEEELPTMPGSV